MVQRDPRLVVRSYQMMSIILVVRRSTWRGISNRILGPVRGRGGDGPFAP
jgi:hypothetical protein